MHKSMYEGICASMNIPWGLNSSGIFCVNMRTPNCLRRDQTTFVYYELNCAGRAKEVGLYDFLLITHLLFSLLTKNFVSVNKIDVII